MFGRTGIRPLPFVAALAAATPVAVHAQAAPVAEIPVLARAPETRGRDAATASLLAAILAARDTGMPWMVEDLSERISTIAQSDIDGRELAALALADARLQRGVPAEVADALAGVKRHTAAKSLRLALAAFSLGKFSEAKRLHSAAPPAELDSHDRLWHTTLDGLLDLRNGQSDSGDKKLGVAKSAATHAIVANQIAVLRWRALMAVRPPDETPLGEIGKMLDLLPDSRQGFQVAKAHAFQLHRAGKNTEAILKLESVSLHDLDLRAERRLITGLLAGGRSPEGRAALLDAIATENYPGCTAVQAAALAALVEAVLGTPRDELSLQIPTVDAALASLLANNRATGVADRIRFARARIKLAEPTDAQLARNQALSLLEELLEKHPTSPLKNDTLLILAGLSRDTRAFRKAAAAYEQLATAAPASEAAELRLLAADCYRENGDHDNAAAAYSLARKSLPDAESRGAALVGEIRSLLATGRTDDARRAVADAAGVAEAHRVKANWLVADTLRRAGAVTDAASIITAALAARPEPDAPTRLRFLWLRALIELDTARGGAAAGTADAIATLAASGANSYPEIRDNMPAILAQTALLRARASLSAGDTRTAADGFAKLRLAHPDSLAAASSYLVEGRHLAATGRHTEALATFRAGYDAHHRSPRRDIAAVANDALLAAAVQCVVIAEKRGAEKLIEAFNLLDELTQNDTAKTHFHRARLMQGDILRRRNEFDSAYNLYDKLARDFPDHPDHTRAAIAKADCLLEKAEAGARQELYPVAAAEYERLLRLPGRSDDLAAEAAYKRALAVSRTPVKGGADTKANERLARRDAAKLLWIQTEELLNPPSGKSTLGSRGRHWISRSLILLADLGVADGLQSEARAALRRLIDFNAAQGDPSRRLPGEALVRARLNGASAPQPSSTN